MGFEEPEGLLRGVGPERLRGINPRLVYCGISGFGNDGPWKDRPAFDTVSQAVTGFLRLLVNPANPRVVGPAIGDAVTGFYAAFGVVAALFTSEDQRLFGQHIRERDAHRWEVFRRQFPDLPEGDARRTFATLRHLMSSASYLLYRLRFGLSPAEATEAIRSAALQIVERAARRDRATERGADEQEGGSR